MIGRGELPTGSLSLISNPWDQGPADLAISVGEASGDWIGALAIESLLSQPAHVGATSSEVNRTQPLRVEGIAGPKLRSLQVSALHRSEELSVRGYVEVLRHLPRLLRMRKNLKIRWGSSHKPKVLLGVDAPDFNLNLELAVRQAGVPTVQLVCPSIWAWRMERIHKIKAACDHVLCIFPFEPEILAKEGIASTYIGHPMASIIPEQVNVQAYRAQLGLDADAEYLAVLPGSRGSELKYIGPAFIATAQLLRNSKPKLKFITPLPNADFVRNFSHSIPPDLRDEWMVIQGQSHEVMGASNAVLLASGTATLEAMMFKKPMVIAYKMPWLSYQMMKGKGYMPYVGLPNIMAQQFAVPELLQSQATPEAIAEATLFQLDNDTNRKRLESLFLEKHLLLKRPSGELAANVLRQYLA